MSRRKLVIIVLTLVCIILAISYTLNFYKAKSSNGQPENPPAENPEGPEFMVPESPIGILGIISALAAAFGVFAVAKKRKHGPNFLS